MFQTIGETVNGLVILGGFMAGFYSGGIVVTPAPHVCQPAGFTLSYDFTQFEPVGAHTRFDLSHAGITEWTEDC